GPQPRLAAVRRGQGRADRGRPARLRHGRGFRRSQADRRSAPEGLQSSGARDGNRALARRSRQRRRRRRGEAEEAVGGTSPSPRLRGEGRGEGDSPQTPLADSPPHPKPSASTSPRKRGEVIRLADAPRALIPDSNFKQRRSFSSPRSRGEVASNLRAGEGDSRQTQTRG